jgi:hypothetical protein
MRKAKLRCFGIHAEVSESRNCRIKSNLSQSNDYFHTAQQFHFPDEEWPAVQDLSWQKLVLRRSASTGCSDITIREAQTVATRNRSRLIGKTKFVKCAIQPITASIACEHSSRAISTMSSRGESDEQELSRRIAEARVWSSPILPVRKSSGLLFGNEFSPLHKAGAEAAMDYASLKLVELSHPVLIVAGRRLHHPGKEVDQVLVEFRRVLQIAHVSSVTDDLDLRSGDLSLHGF